MIWSQFTLYEFSPRGQDSISPVPHDDCSGTISGDKDSTLKIMIKVPMNLIRQKSPLEMCLLDASPVCTVVKYGPRVESTLPLPEERLFAAAITWQTSTRTETMDSEHNEGYVWNYCHPSRSPKFNNAVWRQDNISENQNVAKSISLSLGQTQAADLFFSL